MSLDDVVRNVKAKQRLWEKEIEQMRSCKFATICVHGAYTKEEAIRNNQGAVIEPVYTSTSQAFQDSDYLEAALAYKIPSWAYSRIANPTIGYLELMLAMLEAYGTKFKTTACCTSSGMAAIKAAAEPFLTEEKKGKKNIVSMAQVYGGTFQLFSERFAKERGIEVRWVENPGDIDEWKSKIDGDTCFAYGEIPSNPGIALFDIAKVAELAHAQGAPLITDATLSTPALCRPLAHGSDIVVHSVTKSMTWSGRAVGGVLVSKENIVSNILSDEAKQDFAGWVKLWPLRDSRACISPDNASRALDCLRVLPSTMNVLSENSMKVAEFLESHPGVEHVNYPGLASHSQHEIAKRYMRLADTDVNRYGHLLSFEVKGGHDAARKVLDRMRFVFGATDLGRIKSVAVIPAISTHQQQGEEGRKKARIPSNLVRLCVGAEDAEDLVNELKHALG
ncbi:MAG: aminotransferase class I/II-fold pyridoxal phosphate-dependent enzyme [Candidatus ainarchaeum sp.]|nr:aminotransferase class I/II-fold pyridoxal phosphate-dependent enzyme [Candidatus ainarchaeum sp.]